MEEWKEELKGRQPRKLTEKGLERTAVLLPFYVDNSKDSILFTRRSEDLSRHAGQVSFPGGRKEEKDSSLIDTALRELEEEIGVPRQEVEVFGALDDVNTTTGYSIRPYVGEIPYPYDFEIQEEEVDTLIFAPIEELTHPSIHETRTVRDDVVIHYFHYDDYTIWGATAQILVQFLRLAYDWDP